MLLVLYLIPYCGIPDQELTFTYKTGKRLTIHFDQHKWIVSWQVCHQHFNA